MRGGTHFMASWMYFCMAAILSMPLLSAHSRHFSLLLNSGADLGASPSSACLASAYSWVDTALGMPVVDATLSATVSKCFSTSSSANWRSYRARMLKAGVAVRGGGANAGRRAHTTGRADMAAARFWARGARLWLRLRAGVFGLR